MTNVLRTTSRIGLIATPLLGGALFLAAPLASGPEWTILAVLGLVVAIGPLLLGQLVTYATPLRRTATLVQLVTLLGSWFGGFYAVFFFVPLFGDGQDGRFAAIMALISFGAVCVVHGLIALIVGAPQSNKAPQQRPGSAELVTSQFGQQQGAVGDD